MTDVATLGFEIDSSQTATERLRASTDAMGASARAYTAFGKEIQQFLESEAKSLDDVVTRRYAYN